MTFAFEYAALADSFCASLKCVSAYPEPETFGEPEMKFNERTGNYELHVNNELNKTYPVIPLKLLASFKGDALDRVISDKLAKFHDSEEGMKARQDFYRAVAEWQELQPLSQQEQAFDERKRNAGRFVDSIRQDNSLSETERMEKIEKFLSWIRPWLTPAGPIRGSLANKKYY